MRPYNLSSAFSKVLSFQTAFKSTFTPHLFRSMSSTTPDPAVNRIIDYWLSGPEPENRGISSDVLSGQLHLGAWFSGGPKVDVEIKEQFGSLITLARAGELGSWTTEPKGTLALLILLDQFSRNVFRGKPEMYSADPLALDTAVTGIAKQFDREVPLLGQSFFYLPLMHDEKLLSQVASVAMYESLAARSEPGSKLKESAEKSVKFSERHLTCILRFGRFPSRNEILGRQSTPEEIEYLKEHPHGF